MSDRVIKELVFCWVLPYLNLGAIERVALQLIRRAGGGREEDLKNPNRHLAPNTFKKA